MLVLRLKAGERLIIGDGVVVKVVSIRGGQARLGITAPPSVHIRRAELPALPEKAGALQAPPPRAVRPPSAAARRRGHTTSAAPHHGSPAGTETAPRRIRPCQSTNPAP
jgi:carbon storage regulator